MKNLFPSSGKILLTLALAFIVLMAFSTYRLVHASSVAAFAGLVISCTGLLAVLIVAALDDVVSALKPLLQTRTGNAPAGSVGCSPPLTHRQHLELGIASDVIRSHAAMGGDGARAGRVAREALDALTGIERNVAGPTHDSDCATHNEPAMPAGPCDCSASVAATTLANRVTPADIEATIAAEYSFTLDKALAGCPMVDGLERVTLAVVVLRNGTKLVGVNYGAIDPARHDAEQGRVEARAAAVEQVWPLLGYELRSKMTA